MDYCEYCADPVRHMELRTELADDLQDMLDPAVSEFHALSHLFQDVCWYNFEVAARDWEEPWHASLPSSWVTISATVIKTHTAWTGHTHETLEFPTYYCGCVSEAPPIPPQIILTELTEAYKYLLKMKDATMAVYDYAPGGRKYETLATTTLVGRDASTSSELLANVGSQDDGGGARDARGRGYTHAFGSVRRRNWNRRR